MKNACPACEYQLDSPAAENNICPSCGTEFGCSDLGRSHNELRGNWVKAGSPRFDASILSAFRVSEPVGGPAKTADQPFFGMWSDRDDLADPASYLRSLRQSRSERSERPASELTDPS
jgi:hypothetical protein